MVFYKTNNICAEFFLNVTMIFLNVWYSALFRWISLSYRHFRGLHVKTRMHYCGVCCLDVSIIVYILCDECTRCVILRYGGEKHYRNNHELTACYFSKR